MRIFLLAALTLISGQTFANAMAIGDVFFCEIKRDFMVDMLKNNVSHRSHGKNHAHIRITGADRFSIKYIRNVDFEIIYDDLFAIKGRAIMKSEMDQVRATTAVFDGEHLSMVAQYPGFVGVVTGDCEPI